MVFGGTWMEPPRMAKSMIDDLLGAASGHMSPEPACQLATSAYSPVPADQLQPGSPVRPGSPNRPGVPLLKFNRPPETTTGGTKGGKPRPGLRSALSWRSWQVMRSQDDAKLLEHDRAVEKKRKVAAREARRTAEASEAAHALALMPPAHKTADAREAERRRLQADLEMSPGAALCACFAATNPANPWGIGREEDMVASTVPLKPGGAAVVREADVPPPAKQVVHIEADGAIEKKRLPQQEEGAASAPTPPVASAPTGPRSSLHPKTPQSADPRFTDRAARMSGRVSAKATPTSSHTGRRSAQRFSYKSARVAAAEEMLAQRVSEPPRDEPTPNAPYDDTFVPKRSPAIGHPDSTRQGTERTSRSTSRAPQHSSRYSSRSTFRDMLSPTAKHARDSTRGSSRSATRQHASARLDSTRSAASSGWDRNARASTGRSTSSPTGRFHPDARARTALRKCDMLSNIDYYAPLGAPDNDRRMKEASFLQGQAFIESLRDYPRDDPRGPYSEEGEELGVVQEEALAEGVGHFTGNTLTRAMHSGEALVTPHSGRSLGRGQVPYNSIEHLENDIRMRLGIARADEEWNNWEIHHAWTEEGNQSVRLHMMEHYEKAWTQSHMRHQLTQKGEDRLTNRIDQDVARRSAVKNEAPNRHLHDWAAKRVGRAGDPFNVKGVLSPALKAAQQPNFSRPMPAIERAAAKGAASQAMADKQLPGLSASGDVFKDMRQWVASAPTPAPSGIQGIPMVPMGGRASSPLVPPLEAAPIQHVHAERAAVLEFEEWMRGELERVEGGEQGGGKGGVQGGGAVADEAPKGVAAAEGAAKGIPATEGGGKGVPATEGAAKGVPAKETPPPEGEAGSEPQGERQTLDLKLEA